MFDVNQTQTKLSYPQLKAAIAERKIDDGWSDSYFLKIRGSVNKAAKVFAKIGFTDPEGIPTDSTEVRYHLGSIIAGGEIPKGCGIRSKDAFGDFLSQYISACDVAAGQRAQDLALRTQQDDWSEQLAHADGKRGAPALLGTREGIPLASLARLARTHGVSIKDLSTDSVAYLVAGAEAKTVLKIQKAVDLLNTFLSEKRLPAELLPDAPIGRIYYPKNDTARVVPPINPAYETWSDLRSTDKARHG